MKKILLSLVGILCSLGMWADTVVYTAASKEISENQFFVAPTLTYDQSDTQITSVSSASFYAYDLSGTQIAEDKVAGSRFNMPVSSDECNIEYTFTAQKALSISDVTISYGTGSAAVTGAAYAIAGNSKTTITSSIVKNQYTEYQASTSMKVAAGETFTVRFTTKNTDTGSSRYLAVYQIKINATEDEGGSSEEQTAGYNKAYLYYDSTSPKANSCVLENGYTIAITGNTGKSFSAGNGIFTIKGNQYKTLKNSNGAQMTITAPEGQAIRTVTFYATANYDDRGNPVLKEINGETINYEVTSLKDYDNPSAYSYDLAEPQESVTFTYGSCQVCFIAIVNGTYTVAVEPSREATATIAANDQKSTESLKLDEPASVTFTATPNRGYAFEAWVDAKGNTVSTENPYTVNASADLKLAIQTSPLDLFLVSAEPNDEELGSVALYFDGQKEDGPQNEFYVGEKVTIDATPAAHYTVQGWTINGVIDEANAGKSSITITVSQITEVVAIFAEKTYNVTAQPTDEKYGTAKIVDAQGNEITEPIKDVEDQPEITAIAEANDGYEFAFWSLNGDNVSEDPEYTFVPTEDAVLVANFAKEGMSELKDAIDEAKEAIADESVNSAIADAIQKVIDVAEGIYADPEASEFKIKAAILAMDAATAAADNSQIVAAAIALAVKGALYAQLQIADRVLPYLENTDLAQAIDNGYYTYSAFGASVPDVVDAMSGVIAAVAYSIPGLRGYLQQLIEAAALAVGNLAPFFVEDIDYAVMSAKAVMENPDATAEDYCDAIETLSSKMANAGAATGINAAAAQQLPDGKYIDNNRIVIKKNGRTYNTIGQ